MREILFRGQIRKKGEKVRLDGSPVDGIWVFGGVTQFNRGGAIIYQTEPRIEKFPVHGDTVGQYTGLTDKNGRKIFEGDIVNLKGNPAYPSWGFVDYNALVVYSDGAFSAIDGTEENHGLRRYNFTRAELDVEVIGNIHDNPELLEVKAVQSSI